MESKRSDAMLGNKTNSQKSSVALNGNSRAGNSNRIPSEKGPAPLAVLSTSSNQQNAMNRTQATPAMNRDIELMSGVRAILDEINRSTLSIPSYPIRYPQNSNQMMFQRNFQGDNRLNRGLNPQNQRFGRPIDLNRPTKEASTKESDALNRAVIEV